jgi:hypothetical protein
VKSVVEVKSVEVKSLLKSAEVLPEGTAAAAGMQARDVILEIEDQRLHGMVAPDITAMLRGGPGTNVVLLVCAYERVQSTPARPKFIDMLSSESDGTGAIERERNGVHAAKQHKILEDDVPLVVSDEEQVFVKKGLTVHATRTAAPKTPAPTAPSQPTPAAPALAANAAAARMHATGAAAVGVGGGSEKGDASEGAEAPKSAEQALLDQTEKAEDEGKR